VGDGGAAEVEDGMDVNIEAVVPGLGGQFKESSGDESAGGVDEDVDAAEAR
jgi:hypothetical protein